MAVWETEDESPGPAVISLPTPADTPYRSPSRNSRRSSRRSVTPPGKTSSSPPPGLSDKSDKGSKRSSRDVSNDEHISVLDPRRFTPTLHAKLVSEILTLRRDQEDKTKFIDGLETNLHSTTQETETLRADLQATAKENRSLKRQLALLEGGTSSALGELARERDEAVDTATETKKRLETAQKKIRAQEEISERVHDEWAQDKDAWEDEKRKYERRIHVAESRLKAVLDEVAAYQAAQANGFHNGTESEAEEPGKDHDAASIRTMSMTNSIRFSVVNGAIKPAGNSLADELNFDDYDDDTDYGGRESVLSQHNRHARNASRDSGFSKTHKRTQSIESLMRPASVARGKLMNHSSLARLDDGIIAEEYETQPDAQPKATYTDTGVQYSPPPSPKIIPAKPSTPEPHMLPAKLDRLHDVESSPRGDSEIEANQRRKRVHISRPLILDPSAINKGMVNGSSQTVEEPLSPPKTPKSPYRDEAPALPEKPATAMVSTSTQTDIPPPLQQPFLAAPPTQQMMIPSISIHPPTSRPSTPREPRLPQLFKDFGCQVSILTSVPSKTAGVQTEEIRVDQRLDRLPAHLHPSAITSRPTSPRPASPGTPSHAQADESTQSTPAPGYVPPRNPRRLTAKTSLTELTSSPPVPTSVVEKTRDAYPGNNDDGPLSSQRAPMRRPHRVSSLFAGFEGGGSSDEGDEFGNADLSDSEYRTALSAPRPKAGVPRGGKRSSGGTTTSPEQAVPVRQMPNGARSSVKSTGTGELYSSFALADRENKEAGDGKQPITKGHTRSALIGSSNKSSVMRKAAMIQNGIATHQRARSPSLPDPREPPFPIPTRASSRKPPISASAPSDGRASPTSRGSDSWRKNSKGYRSNSIRKVRSAAAIPRHQRYRRHGSRSPPPFSPSTEAPESPGLPPLPDNDITSRIREPTARPRGHRAQNSTNTANTGETGFASQGSSSQATGVVDAIAQTMVGEWMFKYVRRRKSFGVGEATGRDDSSNDRHKRWVWLAPYERAILWSSKQPSSNSTLMGKSGRKLTIQSVLDVKDDNPAPKGSGPVFNRSILILTPQRALKFTAINAERHYVWLTSLSFLAHSQQAIPEINPPLQQPPPLPITEQFALPATKMRKPGIRDSIRLAKGKAPAPRPGAISVASSHTDSAPPSIPSFPARIPESTISELDSSHVREISRDAAEPPYIPRFHERANNIPLHGRKRSNTGGHVPPPLSFRGFSGPIGTGSAYHNSTNSNSTGFTASGSSEVYSQGQASSGWGAMSSSINGPGSVRTSEASSGPSGAVMNNFFDAIGTVRMEAFISPLAFSRFDEEQMVDDFKRVARRRSKELRRRASRDRYMQRGRDGSRDRERVRAGERDSYQSRTTRATTEDVDEWYTRDDPFKGF